jgi:hypothetical protein
MTAAEQWEDHAACRNHPALSPEAWFQLENGVPRGDGAHALYVCRYVCPVMRQCRDWYRGHHAIAGGGWWDHLGKFRDTDHSTMDMYQVAAYLGQTPRRIQTWTARGLLNPLHHRHGRNWFSVTEVMALGRVRGPIHGTGDAYRLHLIKNEQPCEKCQEVHQGAQLLPVA